MFYLFIMCRSEAQPGVEPSYQCVWAELGAVWKINQQNKIFSYMVSNFHTENVAWKTVDQNYVSTIKRCRKEYAVS